MHKIWLPTTRAHARQTGVSTLEQFGKRFGVERVAIGPELSLEDGIAATRWMLEQPIRIHTRCEDGLTRLRAYRFVWDEAKKVFTKKPLHDWTSHTADSARYLACVVKASELLTRKEPPKPRGLPPPPPPTLDDLWEANRAPRAGESDARRAAPDTRNPPPHPRWPT